MAGSHLPFRYQPLPGLDVFALAGGIKPRAYHCTLVLAIGGTTLAKGR